MGIMRILLIREVAMRWIFITLALVVLHASTALAGDGASSQEGLLHFHWGENAAEGADAAPQGPQLKIGLLLNNRLEQTSGFATDSEGTSFGDDVAFDMQTEVNARFNTGHSFAPFNVGLEAELQAHSRSYLEEPGLELAPQTLPDNEKHTDYRYVANGRVSFGPYFHVMGGFQHSDWGMGLLANNGKRRWTPGSALFTDPRHGDLVLRLMMASGPISPAGISVAMGFDQVQYDDILFEDDKATQMVGALRMGIGSPISGGVYVAKRNQEDEITGREVDATAYDATLKAVFPLEAGESFTFEAESALLTGETTLGPSSTFPVHKLRAFGAAARLSYSAGGWGSVLDFLYASGDQNVDDDEQNAFKTDRNFPMGLLLYRHVLGATTARGVTTASNLEMVGEPAPDIERFPTRGSASNTIAFFPRAWKRWDGDNDSVEVYGGPLLAFTEVALMDPFNSRVNGGTPTNALGGSPGSMLGTEIDLGARYSGRVFQTWVTLGLEGGVFLPGSAFKDVADKTMDPVYAWRFMLDYRL